MRVIFQQNWLYRESHLSVLFIIKVGILTQGKMGFILQSQSLGKGLSWWAVLDGEICAGNTSVAVSVLLRLGQLE